MPNLLEGGIMQIMPLSLRLLAMRRFYFLDPFYGTITRLSHLK